MIGFSNWSGISTCSASCDKNNGDSHLMFKGIFF